MSGAHLSESWISRILLRELGDRRARRPLRNAQYGSRFAALQLPHPEHRSDEIDGARFQSEVHQQILVTFLDAVEPEHRLAEAYLVQHDLHEPFRKLDQSRLREVSPSVQVASPGAVGGVHCHLVLMAAGESACQPARDGPQSAAADAGAQHHGMRHQTTDSTISVDEWMDVVEPVMSSGDRYDAGAGARLGWRKSFSK